MCLSLYSEWGTNDNVWCCTMNVLNSITKLPTLRSTWLTLAVSVPVGPGCYCLHPQLPLLISKAHFYNSTVLQQCHREICSCACCICFHTVLTAVVHKLIKWLTRQDLTEHELKTQGVETDASACLPPMTYSRGLRLMPPPVCLPWPWPLTSWSLKLIVSCPCHVDHLCQFAEKSLHPFSKYHVHKFGNRWMDRRTARRHYISGQCIDWPETQRWVLGLTLVDSKI